MKRGSPLSRYTPLVSSVPLARTGRLRTLAEFRAHRPVITPEERRARGIVRARAEGLCEGCRREEATDYAHRVGRAQGGIWCPSNALHLGVACHRWSHTEPIMARSVGWLLRSTDDPATFPALLPVVGLVLLTPDGSTVPVDRSTA